MRFKERGCNIWNGLERVFGSNNGAVGAIVWSQFILECGLRMASDNGNDHIEGDKGNDEPADDKAGLIEGALQPFVLPLLPLPLEVHQVVGIVRLILLKFCSCVLG